ncbi:MAG: hypothetical protein CSA52_03835 [Gammaproteobacteria bacterium]|nr:MAG: hypothetical protein CSB48_10560 [Pseudomonadota bacterium]PIE38010.1 MAG: hypothetical protein CSA52_03835 [Gammaproteobacteria bacterium]
MIIRFACAFFALVFMLPLSAFAGRVELFPYGKVLKENSIKSSDYLVVADQVKWVNNTLRLDSEIRLTAEGEKRLQLIDPGHSSKQAFLFMQSGLEARGAKPVFVCQGRDCGASNLWANQVFQVSRLYGKDREQFYGLYALNQEGHHQLVIVYAIKRGNGRVYLYTEQLTAQTIPPELAKYFGDQKPQLRSIEVSLSERKLSDIFASELFSRVKAMLDDNPAITLWLVCRVENEAATYADSVKASREIVESAREWLVAKGVSASRIATLGIGPFPLEYKKGGGTLDIHFVQN